MQQIFFEKTVIEVHSLHFYASFGTFCIQIGQLFEAQAFEVIFFQKQQIYHFQTFFKDSLGLQKLTNFDAKGAKRSVKM